MAARRVVLECAFDAVTEREALEVILGWARDGDGRTRTVVTVNAAILMMMRKDPRLERAVANADLVVADGKPVVWAARWLGRPLPERVCGVDLMERLLEASGQKDVGIFLLGTTQERLETLARVVKERYPRAVIAGRRNGYFGQEQWAEVCKDVRESGARILLVGMPAPFKEIWCEEHREELGAAVALGVGGSFDVIAGCVARAPRVLREAGLEWLWRLAMEPRKLWKRYLVTNTEFVVALVRALIRKKVVGAKA